MRKYQVVHHFLKEQIQQRIYQPGDLLPSENDLCVQYQVTRTTARKALDGLRQEGFIERLPGIGSRVRERRQSLGLLNVKGFSQAVGQSVQTNMLQPPAVRQWSDHIILPVSEAELGAPCLHFERLRCVDEHPVVLENNWFAETVLPHFPAITFTEGSFFKTLSKQFLIEIVGSQQEIRAESADEKIAHLLQIQTGAPVLHISIKFSTSQAALNIYSELYCNTAEYSIGNQYHL